MTNVVSDGKQEPTLRSLRRSFRPCEKYSITSEYASFIVLENDGEYRRWKIDRRNANRIQRDRAAREQLNRELAQLRERNMQQIGPDVTRGNQAPVQQTASAEPATMDSTSSLPRSTPSGPAPSRPDRGFDIQIPSGGGGGGGGAIDPISGTIALGLAGAAAAARRRRKKRNGEEANRS